MQGEKQRAVLRGMAWLGAAAAALTVILRAWLMPTLRDTDTGLFASGWLPVILLLVVLAALAGLGFTQRSYRSEIVSPAAMPVAVTSLISGALLVLSGLWDAWLWLGMGEAPAPHTATVTGLSLGVLVLQLVFLLLAGVALVRLGLALIAEGATRRGLAGWSMLAPVLWMWFRLARYEMSYASTVRLSQSFFDFGMFILELLFLFKLARYVAGAGKVSAGVLQGYAAATAAFALSAPLTRLCMYLLGDGEAYLASQLAGLPDLAVGMLALVVAFALVGGEPAPLQGETPAQGEPVSESSAEPEEEASPMEPLMEE